MCHGTNIVSSRRYRARIEINIGTIPSKPNSRDKREREKKEKGGKRKKKGEEKRKKGKREEKKRRKRKKEGERIRKLIGTQNPGLVAKQVEQSRGEAEAAAEPA